MSATSQPQGALTNELALVRAVLRGYPASFARADALRAIEVVNEGLAALAARPATAAEGVPTTNLTEFDAFLEHWCRDVPDGHWRQVAKDNAAKRLTKGGATEALLAAWSAWQAHAALAPQTAPAAAGVPSAWEYRHANNLSKPETEWDMTGWRLTRDIERDRKHPNTKEDWPRLEIRALYSHVPIAPQTATQPASEAMVRSGWNACARTVFSLTDQTGDEASARKPDDFMRGRAFEAKSIAKAVSCLAPEHCEDLAHYFATTPAQPAPTPGAGEQS